MTIPCYVGDFYIGEMAESVWEGNSVGELRPGDRVYAYCVECQKQTSHVVIDNGGNAVCVEH